MIDRVKGLTQYIQEGASKARIATVLLGLRTRREEVREQYDIAARSLRRWRLLVDKEVVNGVPPIPVGALRNELVAVLSAFGQDAESIVPASVGQKWIQTHRVFKELDTWLLAAWERKARGLLPVINEDTLEVLAKVPGHRDKVEALRGTLKKAQGLAIVLPEDQAVLDEFNALAERAHKIISGLGSEHFPEAVLAFLRKATQEGAALGSLTAEVSNWLQANQLAEGFHIRAKPTAYRSL